MARKYKKPTGNLVPVPVGYSGTPLVKKLGVREGHAVTLIGDDGAIRAAIGQMPTGASLTRSWPRRAGTVDVVVLAAGDLNAMRRGLKHARRAMRVDGAVWLCWPKKSSGVSTDVSEAAVHAMGLEAGLVDVKVCAVTQVWSGLRFVVRVKDRGKASTR